MGAPPSRPLGLPRERRLKQGRDFSRVKVEGKRLVKGCLIANWMVLAPGSESRLGVITSRRTGPAVARSRARRLLREAFRQHQRELREPIDLVLVARASIVNKMFAEVEKDFLTVLHLAGLLQSN